MVQDIDQSDLWYVKDTGITVLKVDGDLDIEVEESVGKTDKRLSRLFGQMAFGAWFLKDSVNIREIELGPAATLAMDGCEVTLSWQFARQVQELTTNRFRRELAAATDEDQRIELESNIHALKHMLHADETGQCRIYLTGLTSEGQLKGHALIRKQDADIEYIKGSHK